MDQITTIEDAIIARLQGLTLQAAVLPYPDRNFEEYEPLHPNGEILVVYTGEDDGDTESTSLVVQERAMTFALTFVFSSLRRVGTTGGLYAHLEASRISLTGFQPEGCSAKTHLAGVERVKRYKQRWWQYTQSFTFFGLNVEAAEEEQGVLLNRITIMSEGRETVDVTNQGSFII